MERLCGDVELYVPLVESSAFMTLCIFAYEHDFLTVAWDQV